MRPRWFIGMVMVGCGVIAASWGAFDVAQIGECGGEGSPPCPPEAILPIFALAIGLAAAIIGAIFARSGRLLTALFGLILTTGSLAVYLSLFGDGAAVGSDPAEIAKIIPAGVGALGVLLLLVAGKPKAPVWTSGGGGHGDWGGDGGWDGGGGDSGCSSGCGGGCGGGGD